MALSRETLSSCRPRSLSSCALAKTRSLSFHSLSRVSATRRLLRIDQHESPLCEIRFDLSAFDRATTQPIGLLVASFDLAPDLQRQLDRRGRHLFGDQLADRFIDGPARDRLTTRLALATMRAVADIPCLLPAAPGSISNPEMSAASPTHRAALQQGHAFSRWRRSRNLVAATIGLENFEVLLILLPGDVARMCVRDAGEPVGAFAPLLRLLPIGGAPIAPPTVGVGTGIARVVQCADRGRCGQRPKNRDLPVVQARRKAKALLCETP